MLLIVESPNKTKTIRKYLPAGWEVAASVGHIRDLPKGELGVDKANAYRPHYEIIPEKRKVVAELKSRVARVGKEGVVLATDLDREGEAIAFHLCRALGLDPKRTRRVVFPEITKGAVQAALKSPRHVDLRMVAAQEARRVLDRLVGYELSPLARRKLGNEARSAGRVQSAALRIVVERERDLECYEPRKELELTAAFATPAGDALRARYLPSSPLYENLRTLFETLWLWTYRVTDISASERRQGSKPPFTTSTLQQAASTRLKMDVKSTMKHAQNLFEKGFITYHRTDSVTLSEEAVVLIKRHIDEHYRRSGGSLCTRRRFETKIANAQEAHEAIRPSIFEGEAFNDLSADERKVYELIKARAVASQMVDKVSEVTVYAIGDGSGSPFEARAAVVIEPGWILAYSEDEKEGDEGEITPLELGAPLKLESLRALEALRGVPKRYTEANLVRALEEEGIGRPSTYASILNTLLSRGYVHTKTVPGRSIKRRELTLSTTGFTEQALTVMIGKDNGKLVASEIGLALCDFLVVNFPVVMDLKFTARCEEVFDEVSNGRGRYADTVEHLYRPFAEELVVAERKLPDQTLQGHVLGEHDGEAVTVGKSKHGTYVRWRGTFFNLDVEPEQADLKAAVAAIEDGQRQARALEDATLGTYGKLRVIQGRYGPYFTDGKQRASVPRWEVENIASWDGKRAREVFKAQLAYKKGASKGKPKDKDDLKRKQVKVPG